MKIYNFNEFSNQSINESWKDIAIGALLSIQSLCSYGDGSEVFHRAQKKLSSRYTNSSGQISYSPGRDFYPIENGGFIKRTGLGGVPNDNRQREIITKKSIYTNRGGNHKTYIHSHISSENYGKLYNRLLNDLDSINIQDSNLLKIKKELQWSNHEDPLDIPYIISEIRKTAESNKFTELYTILDNIEKYKYEDIKKMSESDTSRERSKLLSVSGDLKALMDDQRPLSKNPLFIFSVLLLIIILLIVILGRLGRWIQNNRANRANRQQVDFMDEIQPNDGENNIN